MKTQICKLLANTRNNRLAIEKESGSDLFATGINTAQDINGSSVKRTPYKPIAMFVSLVWRRPVTVGPGTRFVIYHSGVAKAL
jgi:hypothetical protein